MSAATGAGVQRNIKLTLAYDGTMFVGWQRQADGVSIQGLLEQALARIEGAPVSVVGAGRTDAGVHAVGQVAAVRLNAAIDLATLRRALNAVLPAEVRVLDVEAVPSSFHARYCAHSKTYRYQIINAPVASPFAWRYAWQIPQPLDVDRMDAAARLFVGEHDFAAFRATGGSVATSRRRVYDSGFVASEPIVAARWLPGDHTASGTRLSYEVTATGFLRHMVRAIVGTLVEVGKGRRDPASIVEALESGNRSEAGPTAPACGLWLVSVQYQ